MGVQLKLPEVARRLGVSEKTARRYVKSGALPSMFVGNAYRVSEEDVERFLQQSRVPVGGGSGKAQRRSSLEPRLFNGGEDERHLRYLRGWRAFVYGLERRWRENPPKTAAEISPLFDAMTALVEQGVFDPSEASPSEAHELMLLTLGFQGLNDIADTVEKGEEAEQRRATFTLIQENIGA